MKRIIFFSAFFVFLRFITCSQSSYYTPYSRFGPGLPNREGNDLMSFFLGGLNIAYASPNFISYQNPAGLAVIGHSEDSLSFLFSGNVSGQYARIQSQQKLANPFNMSLNSFAAGFRINNKIKLGIGTTPYTTIDYRIRINDMADTVQTINTYQGKGGLNNLWLGSGIQVNQFFSIGLKLNFIYGSIQHDKKIVFSGVNFLHTRILSQDFYSGFVLDGGLMGRIPLKNWELTIGLAGKIRQKVYEEITFQAFRYYISGDFEYIYDTVALNVKNKGKSYLPAEWKGGVFLQYKQNIGFGINFSYVNWGTYSSLNNIDTLKQEIVFSFGGKFIPDVKSQRIIKRSVWVWGLRYEQIPFMVNHHRINSISGSAGIVMPLAPVYQKLQQSKLALGVEIGKMGVLRDGLIRQQYVLFKFGIIFSEKWFEKRFYR